MLTLHMHVSMLYFFPNFYAPLVADSYHTPYLTAKFYVFFCLLIPILALLADEYAYFVF